MKSLFFDKSFRTAAIISFVFLSLGFTLLHYGLVAYGWAFFILLPVVTGVAIGALPNRKWAHIGLLTSLAIFFLLLLVGQLEGMICVLMALPLVVSCLFLGSVVTHLVRRRQELPDRNSLPVLVLPFLFFLLSAPAEKALENRPAVVAVRTDILLPYSAAQVYEQIKSVDTLDAPKPFLLQIGLPIPQKCVLEREAVGARRICYFSGGQIVERVTELHPGEILRMDVVRYQLTGRKWLGFKEAIYLFEQVDAHQTRLSRITTYTSELKPRTYWQPLEQLGISQEHQYVFDNLRQDLERAYGQVKP
ncbi:polyketide cyclase [Hymenobacter aerilatus]|uniref:Polyketide cyclase n=1 Tax=Hymenobacter aerilatus TaxID=2932251 RepID=A0A8T9SXB1_9BACT|nr:polyketide cyclase [Hymenobacter aerilatus]UOR06862.1 polyketide cyclase [Hymenobacter aerilatus]